MTSYITTAIHNAYENMRLKMEEDPAQIWVDKDVEHEDLRVKVEAQKEFVNNVIRGACEEDLVIAMKEATVKVMYAEEPTHSMEDYGKKVFGTLC